MALTILVFVHLVATCAAIGTLISADVRLAVRLFDYRASIPRPEAFETRVVAISLAVLVLSGIGLIMLGMASRPDYLSNGKLQGKLVLVALLTLNALLLHARAFPILALARPVSEWNLRQRFTVALAASVSNSLWFLCAFLGVARHWNHQVSVGFVLALALAVWSGVFLLVHLVLRVGGREGPRQPPDRLDAWISRVRRRPAAAAAAQPPALRSLSDPSANQQHYGRRIADRRAGGTADRRVSRRH